ncbi:MAG: CDP-diacylglycerol--glycerol-3-phosphate 3-phosphatidyltransferase [Acidobacteriia bacterium]|nr:CDP-diacylglycerol--glycerol-3-phosphate 3-phosphatidyltransferase [Terriglobia bacterium]
MPRWANPANVLTILRLLLVPFVIVAIVHGNHLRALVLFAGAALTDGLDGLIARRFGLTTRFGAYLDPIADKCLLSGVFLALAASRLAPRWLVGIIFGRDLYLLCASAFLFWFAALRSFTPSVWGKLSTFVQIVAAALWMVRNAAPTPILDRLAEAIVWPCAALTIWSGLHYTWRARNLVVKQRVEWH